MTPENKVKNEILAYLESRKIFVFPIDSVGIWDAKKKIYRKRWSRFHVLGVSDILGIYKGRPLAIEVKSRTGYPSEHQLEFIQNFKEQGGIAFVARSVDDVINGIHLADPTAIIITGL